MSSSPGKSSVVGLGARPGRAGSIGRDTPGHGESTALPPQEAGGASPCPIHGEISASWFQAEWTGAQTMGTLCTHVGLFLLCGFLRLLLTYNTDLCYLVREKSNDVSDSTRNGLTTCRRRGYDRARDPAAPRSGARCASDCHESSRRSRHDGKRIRRKCCA